MNLHNQPLFNDPDIRICFTPDFLQTYRMAGGANAEEYIKSQGRVRGEDLIGLIQLMASAFLENHKQALFSNPGTKKSVISQAAFSYSYFSALSAPRGMTESLVLMDNNEYLTTILPAIDAEQLYQVSFQDVKLDL